MVYVCQHWDPLFWKWVLTRVSSDCFTSLVPLSLFTDPWIILPLHAPHNNQWGTHCFKILIPGLLIVACFYLDFNSEYVSLNEWHFRFVEVLRNSLVPVILSSWSWSSHGLPLSPQTSRTSCAKAGFSPCPHMVSSLCVPQFPLTHTHQTYWTRAHTDSLILIKLPL